jgi:hypothetical protein
MDYLQQSDPEFTHLQMSEEEYLEWLNDVGLEPDIDPEKDKPKDAEQRPDEF